MCAQVDIDAYAQNTCLRTCLSTGGARLLQLPCATGRLGMGQQALPLQGRGPIAHLTSASPTHRYHASHDRWKMENGMSDSISTAWPMQLHDGPQNGGMADGTTYTWQYSTALSLYLFPAVCGLYPRACLYKCRYTRPCTYLHAGLYKCLCT